MFHRLLSGVWFSIECFTFGGHDLNYFATSRGYQQLIFGFTSALGAQNGQGNKIIFKTGLAYTTGMQQPVLSWNADYESLLRRTG